MDQQQEVVLVVDDEPPVRLDGSETLYSAGFEVCEAASVLEALTVLDERPDMTVLLTDVHKAGRHQHREEVMTTKSVTRE